MSTATIKDWRDYPPGKEKYHLYLASRDWAILKERVRARSGGHCERCFNEAENVHHRTPESLYRERIEDLIHVCASCRESLAGPCGEVEYRAVGKLPGYRVGDDGSAWSCWKRGAGGKPVMSDDWRKLKGIVHEKGYLTIGVRGRHHYIHVLVLEAFVGPCPPGMECRHADGDPTNNRLSNLSWGTPAQNAEDRIRHGTSGRGEKHSQVKLTADDVREIVRLKTEEGIQPPAIARRYGVHTMTIWGIFYGRSWGHVTGFPRLHKKPICRRAGSLT